MTDRYEQGLRIRREVVGDAYVDAALANMTDFNRPMQELVTEYCWGAVWARPQLDRRSRSILNLGMLTALGRLPELETHVRAALTNGVTREEIREVFMQTAIYLGIPAALDSFRAAERVFAGIDADAPA
jgi:4-carboxymuconolactone decarboxylase